MASPDDFVATHAMCFQSFRQEAADTRFRVAVTAGVILTAILLAQNAGAQGSWMPTGSMGTVRRDHTAVLLADGRVLIVGWYTNAAELYDPSTGRFSATGDALMSHGQGVTGTRLADGKVLIVGGYGAPQFAETYDPATGTFSAAGSLNQQHIFHTSTRLLDGTVIVIGGPGVSAELFDPETRSFSVKGDLLTPRRAAAASLLPDGQVLVAGGSSEATNSCLNAAELYNPTTGTFSYTGAMTVPRCALWWSGAPVLPNGTVLIAGGMGTTPSLRSAELYDPAAKTFRATGNMAVPRDAATVTLLSDGWVLVAGGSTGGGPVTTASAELYDPVAGTFSSTASMTVSRQQHTATLLANGRVLVTGGFNPTDQELSSAEIFAPHPSSDDLNGDGRMDIVLQHSDGWLAVWFMEGTRLLDGAMLNPSYVDPAWKIVGTGDANHDGKADIYWQHDDGRLAVWYMNGWNLVDGAQLTPAYAPPGWKVRAVGDLNNDGKPDLILQHVAGGLAVWYMDGLNIVDGRYLTPNYLDPAWHIVGTGDVDQNGKTDLVLQNQTDGSLAVWFMDGAVLVDGTMISPSRAEDQNWRVHGVGDLNGDGRPDLLWQHTATGDLAGWIMNGAVLVDGAVFAPPNPGDPRWRIVGPR